MFIGEITEYIDVAQLVLYAFWIFFVLLILYLRREDRREGYPLENDNTGEVATGMTFASYPDAKVFLRRDGSTYTAPSGKRDTRELKAQRAAPWPGAPIEPTGNPLVDGVGPASYAEREDTPDTSLDGTPRIVPLRVDPAFGLAPQDTDPRGLPVNDLNGETAGTVVDVWVDRSDILVRYLEIEVKGAPAARPAPAPAKPGQPPQARPIASSSIKRVLMPMTVATVRRDEVQCNSILARHFPNIPVTKKPDQVTLLEEDKIQGYFAGGALYAEAV